MTIINNTSPFLYQLHYGERTSAEQALIDSLIEVAEEYLQTRLWNRYIAADDYVNEKHDGTGEPSIFVFNPPINSIVDIDLVVTIPESDDDVTTYDDTYFDYESKTGEIRFKGHCNIFPCGFQNIHISYNGGFSPVPKTVEMLIADFVMFSFDPGLLNETLEKEKLGDYFYAKAIEVIEKFPTSKKKLFNSYKLYRVPAR